MRAFGSMRFSALAVLLLVLVVATTGVPAARATLMTVAVPQHFFDFRAAVVHDAGAAGAWAASRLNRGWAITPSTTVSGALTVSVTAMYSADDNVTRTVFDLGGLKLRINPSRIDVGAGAPVYNFADVANNNGASIRCSQVRRGDFRLFAPSLCSYARMLRTCSSMRRHGGCSVRALVREV
jgi:hypothetical protein